MRLNQIQCFLVVRPSQFGDDSRFEHTMGEINVANLFARGAGHKNATLGYRFQPTLGNQPMQDFTDTLARDVKNGGEPMLRQFRARRQPPLEKSVRQRRVDAVFERGPIERDSGARRPPAPCASWLPRHWTAG